MVTPPTLDRVLALLREREADLRHRGVVHAAVFGSVARGDQQDMSDIELMVDLDRTNVPTLFEYIGIALDLEAALERPVDMGHRDS
jgi:predicted nucleotidyltransferase